MTTWQAVWALALWIVAVKGLVALAEIGARLP